MAEGSLEGSDEVAVDDAGEAAVSMGSIWPVPGWIGGVGGD